MGLPAARATDPVVCPGVRGPNLAASALAAYRNRFAGDGPPVRITIEKHIPNLERKNYPAIAKDLQITMEEVIEAARAAHIHDFVESLRVVTPAGVVAPARILNGVDPRLDPFALTPQAQGRRAMTIEDLIVAPWPDPDPARQSAGAPRTSQCPAIRDI